MPKVPFFIDLHCHPNYKAFARAHFNDIKIPEEQASGASQPSSLWFYDPPTLKDKLLNFFLSVTKFRQSDLASAFYGNTKVLVLGLGSVEKWFFRNKLGGGLISELANDFVAGFRRPRIDTIQNMKDYWMDFLYEVEFIKGRHSKVIKMDGQFHCYKIAKNFNDLLEQQSENDEPGVGESKRKPNIISLIFSSEGLHILNCGLENPCKEATVLKNAKILKNLEFSPWFVTFSHHFYNELCGHARSLRKEVAKLTNQEEGLNTSFTPLGLKVLKLLLDKEKGRRILIDSKHLSPLARKDFRDLIEKDYPGEIPVFMSHGVCNGLPTHGATVSNYPLLGNTFINKVEIEIKNGVRIDKDPNEINFYDDEIIAMVKTNGVIGIQLDERRLANDDTLAKVKKSPWKNKIMHYRSELMWKQVQYIAELLDDQGLFAWGNMCIGSDYDGMVDPLNSFWTMEEFDDLMQYLERHAWEYVNRSPHPMKNSMNQIPADKIVQNIFQNNAWDFFQRWF